MLHVTAAGWAATLAVIAGLLIVDWFVLGRRPHTVRFGEAARWSAFYIAVAVLFGVVFGLVAGWDLGAQYFAGYVVEKSLSVDNLFVFMIIISAFAVPAEQQPKALTIGITVALGLRAVFIALGAALLTAFSVMFPSSGWRWSELRFSCFAIATTTPLWRTTSSSPPPAVRCLSATATTKGGSSRASPDTARSPHCSWCSCRSAAPTCCSRLTRSPRYSA